jgi:hypothetical protein
MKFVNDGSWFYMGNRNNESVYVKYHECLYVDKSGQIVASPEEREMLQRAQGNLKRLTGKG